ncbi:P-loop containing nucleoside triphosphate hydrolase protein [Patellaria atrata CBS 101060]|uniref:RNA helicase n=1 Tax=Patellaria atrata CBS 101060 TaxID=1346257 RepID=A0A9P4SJ16_9PEZI|nr:P-loop containing nucleoside triphosphate hydrolase protein [Patellaria atrata CBS 101060]
MIELNTVGEVGRRSARAGVGVQQQIPNDRRDDRRNDRRSDRREGRRDERRDDRRYDHRDERRDDRRADDHHYRPDRRERSPNSRYRERSSVRDRRHRSRSKDRRERRENSRDRARLRDDDSADSRRRHRRDNSRDRPANERSNDKSDEPNLKRKNQENDDAEAKRRLAKLEAWKAKQLAQKEQKRKEEEAMSGNQILQAMEKRENAVTDASNQNPEKIVAEVTDNKSDKTLAEVINPFADLPVPLNGSIPKTSSSSSIQEPDQAPPSLFMKKSAKISRFGFSGKTNAESENTANKAGLGFEDEESSKKKLQKLSPTMPVESLSTIGDPMVIDGATEAADASKEDENINGNDRSTSSKASKVQDSQKKAASEDTPMKDVAAYDPVTGEELDPVDAYLSTLTFPDENKPQKFSRKLKKEVNETILDDENNELDAVELGDPEDILALANKKKRKEIPIVDHSKVEYIPFRKNFYVEPQEYADMTEEELADLRLELDGIKIRAPANVKVPKPVQSWGQCGLNVPTMEVIRKLGYEKPSAIQTQAIPAIMAGLDVIGVAKTGSGKTVAFLLPMFRHILDQPKLTARDGPIAIIMAPTRELAVQIHKDAANFARKVGLRAVCCYGGAPIKDQIAELKRGCEIVIVTPGRFVDLLTSNSGRLTNLRRVTYVVLDEADRMFDMGFEPQVTRILQNVRPDRQTVLFSATMPPKLEGLVRKTMRKPVEITVGGRSVVAPEITQMIEIRPENSKLFRVLELLGELFENDEDARSLIFVERQETADIVLRDLMRKGYPCQSIHGAKDQIDRDSAIDDFKNGVIPVLVATSVAARGLDVKQLKLVINYDSPSHLEDYVHRAGRTGRAGNLGTAVTFLTPEQERYAPDIAKALKQSGQPIPEELQKLVDSHLQKVKEGKAKATGLGFGGKGLEHIAAEREAMRGRERGQYKTGDDPEDDKDDKTAGIEIVVKSSSDPTPSAAADTSGIGEPLIVVHKRAPPPASKPGKPLDKLEQVRLAAASINGRLTQQGQLRGGQPVDNKGPDAGAFHATLEINDYPQKARWAVTNRTNVAKILDATGTSITTKGSYYPTGKEPNLDKGDNPKLYILVEGDTEIVVKTAMHELVRLLKEGTIASSEFSHRAAPTGKYKVL